MSETAFEERRQWALAEAQRMLDEGYLFPADYVMLDGVEIAHVDIDGNLVPRAPLAKPGVP